MLWVWVNALIVRRKRVESGRGGIEPEKMRNKS